MISAVDAKIDGLQKRIDALREKQRQLAKRRLGAKVNPYGWFWCEDCGLEKVLVGGAYTSKKCHDCEELVRFARPCHVCGHGETMLRGGQARCAACGSGPAIELSGEPSCVVSMRCLCFAHANGAPATDPCDATERPVR